MPTAEGQLDVEPIARLTARNN